MSPLRLTFLPLTHAAWAPYGDVIQGTEDPSTMPASVTTNRITATPILVRPLFLLPPPPTLSSEVNLPQLTQGHKFNRISPIISTYPAAESGSEPITSISVIRIGPPAGLALGSEFAVRMLERHAATTQAFVPMAKAGRAWDAFNGQTALERDGEEAGGMVVVGCLNGAGAWNFILLLPVAGRFYSWS